MMEMMIWLEVAIGLASLYLLLSLVASGITELGAAWLGLRAKDLRAGLTALLGPEVYQRLKGHPLIAGLSSNPKRGPSYIPSRLFALALLDLQKELAATAPPAAGGQSQSANVARALDLLGVKEGLGGEDLERALKNVTMWFDSSMDRLSGSYKRRAHFISLGCGVVLAFAVNADTLRIAQRLYTDGPRREVIVDAAKKLQPPAAPEPKKDEQPKDVVDTAAAVAARVAGSPAGTVVAGGTQPVPELRKDASATAPTGGTDSRENKAVNDVKAAQAQLQASLDALADSKLPIGWEPGYLHSISGLRQWVMLIVGMLLTAFAVGLGAPFWFDTLGKLLNLRSTLKELAPATAPKGKDK